MAQRCVAASPRRSEKQTKRKNIELPNFRTQNFRTHFLITQSLYLVNASMK